MSVIRLLAALLLMAVSSHACALVYHTRNDGNWTANNVWRTGGTVCTSGTNTGTPPDADDTVTICNGHDITLNTSPTILTLNIATGGSLSAGANTLTLSGTAGTLFTRVGTFTPGTGTVVTNPNASVTLTSGTITFNNLTISPTITAARAYTFGAGAITVNGAFLINPTAASAQTLTVNMGAAITVAVTQTTTIQGSGSATGLLSTTATDHALTSGRISIAAGGSFNANDSTVTLNATTGVLFSRVGTFTPGGSTVVMNPNASFTGVNRLTDGAVTFNNLTLSPTITAARTYTFGDDAVTTTGNLLINPNAAAAFQLTVNQGAALTVGPAGTTTIQRTGSATSLLDTIAASNFAFGSGRINIATGGTFTANNSTVTLNATSGTLLTRVGTFNEGTSTVVMNPDADVTLTSGSVDFYDLQLTPAITINPRTYTFGAAAITARNFAVSPSSAGANQLVVNFPNIAASIVVSETTSVARTGTATALLTTTANNRPLTTANLSIGAGGTFAANDSTVTLNGTTGTLFAMDAAGAFTAGTSTVVMNPNASVTLTSGPIAFNDLTLSPTLTAPRTYTFGAEAITASGNFLINPNSAGANALTVNMGAGITVAVGGTTTIQRTGTATSVLNTTTSNHALSTGRINIATGGTFTANDSVVTLTANAGATALFTRVGTFNQGNSTVAVTTDSSRTLTSGTVTFHHLHLIPTLVDTNRTYTFGASAVTCNGDLLINPQDSNVGVDSLTVNLGAALTVVGHTSVQGSGTPTSATATLSTTGTDYAFTTGRLSVLANGTFNANDSTVTLNGGTGPLLTRTGTFTQGGSTVVLAASASVPFNSGTVTFNRLRMNMPGLIATMGDDVTIALSSATALDFDNDNDGNGDGFIATGTNTLILQTTTTLVSAAGASGHVIGNVQRAFANTSAATRTFTFPLGDGVNYAPVTVVFSAGMTAGNLTAATFAPGADHPQTVAGGTPAEPNKSVNRYWTLKNSTAVGTADVTFNYQAASPADLDIGVTVGSFRAGRGATCSGTGSGRQCLTWTRPTLLGTPTTTQAVLDNLAIANLPTSEFDYVVGEARRVSREKEFIFTRETY